MNMEDKIKLAFDVIYKNNTNIFNKIYPFTTENLNGCFSNFDFKDKSVLTVGSSCDQIFNLHLLGARKITCFDVNPFTDVYYDLKSSAIDCFEYEEFINFFAFYVNSVFFRNRKVFNSEIFEKIFLSSNVEGLYFWKYLLSNFSGKYIRKKLFTSDEYPINILTKANNYLTKDGYVKLKKSIKSLNPTFITSDFKDISALLNENFDYIILSNIGAYIEKMYDNPLIDFKNHILEISQFLNKDGLILLAYLYNMTPTTVPGVHWDIIYKFNLVSSVFGQGHLFYKQFESVKELASSRNNDTDMILVYRK